MELRHVIEAQQFDREWLENKFFPLAKEMEEIAVSGGSQSLLAGKRMVTFFYEPSTRTRCSFEIAMDMLGGRVVFSTENAGEFSSAAKGETIEDTMRVVSGYLPHVIVLRSYEEGMAERASKVSMASIINAGDGKGQHPTQALLDLYTIWKEIGRISEISIAMVGDLLNGRTVRSLSYLIGKFKNVKIYFVSPESLRMRDDIKEYLRRHDIWFTEDVDLRNVVSKVDVVYQTRTQKERGALVTEQEISAYIIGENTLEMMKDEAIVMHPLPRVGEILLEVDKDHRAAYFRQAQNGLFVRMALLLMLLGNK